MDKQNQFFQAGRNKKSHFSGRKPSPQSFSDLELRKWGESPKMTQKNGFLTAKPVRTHIHHHQCTSRDQSTGSECSYEE